jgi:glycosyltransferase involved in cell wall biosynthesis
MQESRPKLLIFVPAYEAARHIEWVVGRIPRDLDQDFRTHILIIDDASQDSTASIAQRALDRARLPYSYEVLVNPRNRGYGGNQKLGYAYAIEKGFEVVVMVHGDGQYPPECVGELAHAALKHGAAFGSRFSTQGGAIGGGMPRYKWLGNRILTWVQNRLLGTRLTEFHSGFRAYAIASLGKIPFELNSDGFHFDTEIFIQLNRIGVDIGEIDIPTHYGDEICRVNGVDYAAHVVYETFKSRVHDMGMFYELKFDVGVEEERYQSKLDFDSPMRRVLSAIIPQSTVLDLGSSSGHLARELANKGCTVIGVDLETPPDADNFSTFIQWNLNDGLPETGPVDVVLMLDVVEHLLSPEAFTRSLVEFCERQGVAQVFVSTGNVAFILQRLALLGGQFNYGRRGILDMTHTRLFTFRTIKRLFRQAGFTIERAEGVPVPIPLATGPGPFASILMKLNQALIRVAPRLFSYQILLSMRPPAPLALLIDESTAHATAVINRTSTRGDRQEAQARNGVTPPSAE